MIQKSRFAEGAQQHAAGYIRDALSKGRWLPGDALDAAAIASELHVSPSPVREALARLRGEGLLETRHRDGYSVPMLQPHQLAAEYWLLGIIAVQLALRTRLTDVQGLGVGDSYPDRLTSVLVELSRSADMPVVDTAVRRTTLRVRSYLNAQPDVVPATVAELATIESLASENRRDPLVDALARHFTALVTSAPEVCRLVFERSKRSEKAFD